MRQRHEEAFSAHLSAAVPLYDIEPRRYAAMIRKATLRAMPLRIRTYACFIYASVDAAVTL